MSKTTPKNILILKYRAMGDSIIGTAAVSYLRSLYPQAHITYGMPAWIAPLFDNVKTDADEILGFNLKSFKDWWLLRKRLKEKKIDLVFELFQSGRTSKFFSLWSKLSGNPYYFHNHHPDAKLSKVRDQGVIKPVIQRDLDGIWSYLANTQEVPSFLQWQPKMQVEAEARDQVVFGVVATRQTKMWDLANYIELAKKIKRATPTTKILVPLSRSQVDEELKDKLIASEAPIEIAQQSLSELPKTLAGSRYYIGNDTGLKHLCIAMGIKTYTLFGPEPPLEWHPYDQNKHPYFYKDGLECRTRDAHYCGLSVCDSMICLREFTPESVFSQLS